MAVQPVDTQDDVVDARRQQAYLDGRWTEQVKYYSQNSARNKQRYMSLQLIIAVGGVVVPVLISIEGVDKIFPTLISMVVAVAAAGENVLRHGDNWRIFRQTVEALKRERALFDAGAGVYRNVKTAFPRFVERCETIIGEETSRFFPREEETSRRVGTSAGDAGGDAG